MKIYHKAGFILGALAVLFALIAIATMWIAGSITGTSVTLSLTTMVIGALCIYWSTLEQQR